ncbi:MAG: hypothetical protein OSJ43_10535 [Oscillospiraceae bacterium]|nr:hypothetical protein [Oscillospiraceae bacterium]
METIIYLALFVLVPTAAVVWFVVSLVRFVKTPKTDPKRRSRGTMALISGIVMGLAITAVSAVIMFLFIYFSAIVHM